MAKSEEKRTAILEAAIQEFGSVGYAAANMDVIATAARVSKRTIYNHFASKEALFLAISAQVCDQLAASQEIPYAPARPVREQLLELALRQLELMGSEEFMMMTRIILPERVRNPDLVRDDFDRLRNGERGLGLWLHQAMEGGALRQGDWVAVARSFSATLAEFGFWPQLIAHDPPLSPAARAKVATSVVDLFLSGILAPQAP